MKTKLRIALEMTLLAVVVSCKKDKEDSPIKQPENQPDTL